MGKVANPRFLRDEDLMHGIEALFFGYRGFTTEPDKILSAHGLGRAHHRALHFVARNPGISVGKLLDVLGITKQSLNRVLRELMERDFVTQSQGKIDRRQRNLHLTPQGKDFNQSLGDGQNAVVRRAYANAGAEAVEGFMSVLEGLMTSEDFARFKEISKKCSNEQKEISAE